MKNYYNLQWEWIRIECVFISLMFGREKYFNHTHFECFFNFYNSCVDVELSSQFANTWIWIVKCWHSQTSFFLATKLQLKNNEGQMLVVIVVSTWICIHCSSLHLLFDFKIVSSSIIGLYYDRNYCWFQASLPPYTKKNRLFNVLKKNERKKEMMCMECL